MTDPREPAGDQEKTPIEQVEEKLARARAELRRWSDAFDNYDGNNPDKYRSEIETARDEVRGLEALLLAMKKERGA
jgi:hypothetical protein